MNQSQKDHLKQELKRLNQGQKKVLKLVYLNDDEIIPLWELEFPIGQTMVQTHIPEKGKMTAYSLTRITDLDFWLSKININFWWIEFEAGTDQKVNARTSGVTYEDSPADIFTAYQILTLSDKWKEKRIGDWLLIFDQVVNFIKMAPSDLSGKILPNLEVQVGRIQGD